MIAHKWYDPFPRTFCILSPFFPCSARSTTCHDKWLFSLTVGWTPNQIATLLAKCLRAPLSHMRISENLNMTRWWPCDISSSVLENRLPQTPLHPGRASVLHVCAGALLTTWTLHHMHRTVIFYKVIISLFWAKKRKQDEAVVTLHFCVYRVWWQTGDPHAPLLISHLLQASQITALLLSPEV